MNRNGRTSQGHRHRRRRPDRLRAAVPDRLRADARARHARSTSSCSRSRDAVKAAEGTALELFDCAFPLLAGHRHHRRRRRQAFDGANVALLVGARPRTKGMERADLLEANGGIFKPQGEAIAAGAADDVKVLVVGNPANTNALIATSPTPTACPRERFTAMTRLDHNRAIAQLAQKTGAAVSDITNMARVGQPLTDDVPRPVQREGGRRARLRRGRRRGVGAPTSTSRRVGKRGAEIIEARGASSAASAANAAIDHVHDWVHGTRDGDWVSMAVPSDGSYGVDEGIISSFPCRARAASGRSSQGLDVPDFSQERIDDDGERAQGGARRGREARTRVTFASRRPRSPRSGLTGESSRHAERASRARTSSPCPRRRGRASRGTGSSA